MNFPRALAMMRQHGAAEWYLCTGKNYPVAVVTSGRTSSVNKSEALPRAALNHWVYWCRWHRPDQPIPSSSFLRLGSKFSVAAHHPIALAFALNTWKHGIEQLQWLRYAFSATIWQFQSQTAIPDFQYASLGLRCLLSCNVDAQMR